MIKGDKKVRVFDSWLNHSLVQVKGVDVDGTEIDLKGIVDKVHLDQIFIIGVQENSRYTEKWNFNLADFDDKRVDSEENRLVIYTAGEMLPLEFGE